MPETKFESREPSNQSMADVFKGKWVSEVPGVLSGKSPKFTDNRVSGVLSSLSLDSLSGMTVLEIGPLEGFHSYQLHSAGAQSVLAIESSVENFLKCLVVKEMFSLSSVSFRLGDAQKFLSSQHEKFDLGWAAGVLYHLQDPVQFIEKLLEHCDRVYIWTHFWSSEIDSLRNGQQRHFAPHKDKNVFRQGKKVKLHARSYLIKKYGRVPLGLWQGGVQDITYWMEKKDILEAVTDAGFEILEVEADGQVNGLPCFGFVAQRVPNQ